MKRKVTIWIQWEVNLTASIKSRVVKWWSTISLSPNPFKLLTDRGDTSCNCNMQVINKDGKKKIGFTTTSFNKKKSIILCLRSIWKQGQRVTLGKEVDEQKLYVFVHQLLFQELLFEKKLMNKNCMFLWYNNNYTKTKCNIIKDSFCSHTVKTNQMCDFNIQQTFALNLIHQNKL